jgi:hypothetical protein
MRSVTFPTGRHGGITWPLACGNEVSEVAGTSEFHWPSACRALPRIDAGSNLTASDRGR